MGNMIFIHDDEIAEGIKNGTTQFKGLVLYHRSCKYQVIEGSHNGIYVERIDN